MKNSIILGAVFSTMLLGASLTSCEDMFGSFLDKQPSNELTKDQTFSSWTNLEEFHFDTYNYLRNGALRIKNSWMDAATDLAETSYATGGVRTTFNIGNYYGSDGASELTDTWELYYRGIRKTNMLLQEIDSVPIAANLTADQQKVYVKEYKAESRFLRAYFYWELFLRYGPVPLVTKVLDPDGDLLSDYKTRPTTKEYLNFVLTELNECESDLISRSIKDGKIVNDDNAGRIDKPIARALACRIKLYMASPRFSSESGITWQDAADAAKSFITDFGSQFSLYKISTNTAVQNYTEAILKRPVDGNPEIIFWRNDSKIGWSSISYDSPVGEGGSGGLCPSQNLVDMYDMANGQSPFSTYDETGAPVYNGVICPDINTSSGYDDSAPYSGRDPRFYATVLYQGATWGEKTNNVINVIKGERDNPVGNANATPTGYYVKKYIPETIIKNNHGNTDYRNWIIIRYAEILLDYAEALNEVQGPCKEVFDALQQIRDRVGMTAKLSERSDLQTQDALRKFIHKERTIEFAFEDQRAWDVRRWGVAEEALGRPIYGMEVTKVNDKIIYTRKKAQDRVFLKKMYLYPIPETEEWKTDITNNEGW